eukprot:TRINITY_DN4505_c1_g1_i1.p2 TRINITY_DN4505_c1_g1~~TRINITY_DN4505_c1_g1_i1.p2  ORF type:complete len:64 (-),score=5.37 TRINITY_DN4505_c1_g1_i1:133-324(-)
MDKSGDTSEKNKEDRKTKFVIKYQDAIVALSTKTVQRNQGYDRGTPKHGMPLLFGTDSFIRNA